MLPSPHGRGDGGEVGVWCGLLPHLPHGQGMRSFGTKKGRPKAALFFIVAYRIYSQEYHFFAESYVQVSPALQVQALMMPSLLHRRPALSTQPAGSYFSASQQLPATPPEVSFSPVHSVVDSLGQLMVPSSLVPHTFPAHVQVWYLPFIQTFAVALSAAHVPCLFSSVQVSPVFPLSLQVMPQPP